MAKFALAAVEQHIRYHHPGCPDFAVSFFSSEIAQRDWRDASLGQAVGITMQTCLRHDMTDYDSLLLHGMDRAEAMRRVQPRVNAMLKTWRRKRKTAKRSKSREPDNV